MKLNHQKESLPLQIVFHLIFLLFLVIMVLPLFWMVLTSFKPPTEVTAWPPRFLPQQWTLQNYAGAFQNAPLLRFLLNSMLVGIVCTLAILLTSAAAGYVFAKYTFPGKDFIFITILATVMIPIGTYIVPLYAQVARWRLVNTYMGLFLPNLIASSGIFFMRQNIASIPDELIDAARIDGASEFYIFPRIIIPLSLSALSALAIFIFMFVWTSFLWPLMIISTKRIMTMEVGLTVFESMFTIEFGPMMAASTIAVLPMLIAFAILRQRVIQSVATTGIRT
jgi:ABC-type glycerol-3-phosphate transport system permease component